MKRLAALAVILVLSACGDELQGEVIKKDFEPGYTRAIPVTTCGGQGCSTGVAIDSKADCFRLVVRTPENEIETACVAEARWAMVEVGDDYVGEDVKP